jgi:hypothetical protein
MIAMNKVASIARYFIENMPTILRGGKAGVTLGKLLKFPQRDALKIIAFKKIKKITVPTVIIKITV